jgi:hypothetical protein
MTISIAIIPDEYYNDKKQCGGSEWTIKQKQDCLLPPDRLQEASGDAVKAALKILQYRPAQPFRRTEAVPFRGKSLLSILMLSELPYGESMPRLLFPRKANSATRQAKSGQKPWGMIPRQSGRPLHGSWSLFVVSAIRSLLER